jgi:hypothetical protein
MRKKNLFIGMAAVVCAGFLSILPHMASAQLNNRPFSFNTPTGGVGMSVGGMQAILNDKILGERPDNLVRGVNGQLLSVTKGPGNAAIVSEENGSFIPRFRGTSYKDGNTAFSAGAFNAYFVPQSHDMGPSPGAVTSSASISTWTSRIMTGAPVSYSPESSVDNWTGMVHTYY